MCAAACTITRHHLNINAQRQRDLRPSAPVWHPHLPTRRITTGVVRISRARRTLKAHNASNIARITLVTFFSRAVCTHTLEERDRWLRIMRWAWRCPPRRIGIMPCLGISLFVGHVSAPRACQRNAALAAKPLKWAPPSSHSTPELGFCRLD